MFLLNDASQSPSYSMGQSHFAKMPIALAGISVYVDDKVIRSGSFAHLEELLARTVKFDRMTGQYLNFDKSMGLCTHTTSEVKLRSLRIEGSPLLIVKNEKTLGALVSSATHPSNYIAKKRVDAAVLTAKRIQKLPIELHKHIFH